MTFLKALPILAFLLFTLAHGTTFEVTNKCAYTVWAAGVPGGGRRLNTGEKWTITANPNQIQGRIWGRTNCLFDESGLGSCQTGDCNGTLECQGYGRSPNTLAEYSLKQFADQDFFDISVIDGFNVPMAFSAVAGGPCTRVIKCIGDINGQCPPELKAPGGCDGPCKVLETEESCCTSGNCRPTTLSMFFKERCPDAYSYPKDDPTSLFTCASGTNYKVIFCPTSTKRVSMTCLADLSY